MAKKRVNTLLGFDVAEIVGGVVDHSADRFAGRLGAKVGSEALAAHIDNGSFGEDANETAAKS